MVTVKVEIDVKTDDPRQARELVRDYLLGTLPSTWPVRYLVKPTDYTKPGYE